MDYKDDASKYGSAAVELSGLAGLIRLSAAARLVGISPELLEAGATNGRIPIEIIKVGLRVKYVRSAELVNWLQPR